MGHQVTQVDAWAHGPFPDGTFSRLALHSRPVLLNLLGQTDRPPRPWDPFLWVSLGPGLTAAPSLGARQVGPQPCAPRLVGICA